MSAADKPQVFSTEPGDTLVALVRRVYDVHEHERVCQIAAIVATATPRNSQAIKQRLHAPLGSGVALDFPAWSQVAARLQIIDTNRQQALAHTRKPMAQSAGLAAPVLAAPQNRSVTKPVGGPVALLLAATGERAEVLARALTLLDPDASNPAFTQSPAAAAVQRVGEAIGSRIGLQDLVGVWGDKLSPALLRMLQTVAPKTFTSEPASHATISVLASGVRLGVARRLDAACREEFARRQALLRTALTVDIPPLGLPAVSVALSGTEAEVIQALRDGVQAPPTVTPKIRAGIEAAWGLAVDTPAPAAIGFARFVDTFDTAHEDGPLQSLLVSFSGGGDVQNAAVTRALKQLELVQLPLTGTPSADFAAVLPEFLRLLRMRRSTLPQEAQEKELAEERRMLAGRNYTSFRKDVNATIDARLTLQVALDARCKRAVYLALLTSIGHRLSGMKKDDIDAALDRLIDAGAAVTSHS